MRVIWYPRARADLRAIRAYIAKDDPRAAVRIIEQIFGSTRRLVAHPHLGRPGRVHGTRELVVTGTQYLVPYQVRSDHIAILRVYHGAQRWPESFEG